MNIDKRIEEIESLLLKNPPYNEFQKLTSELHHLYLKQSLNDKETINEISKKNRLKSNHLESYRFAI